MPTFSPIDISNEVSRLVRGELKPSWTAGLTDPINSFDQLMEVVTASFILHPDSLLYTARLTANRLSAFVLQEAALLENMMVALEYVGQSVEVPVGSATYLRNANTALLALDASVSVEHRPELQVYARNMRSFSDDMKKSVVDEDGTLLMTSEEAKTLLRTDLPSLEEIHAKVLALAQRLITMVDDYTTLDVPSKVAKTTIKNARAVNEEMISLVENGTKQSKEEKRKSMLLRSLVEQSVVDQVVAAQAPAATKINTAGTGATLETTGEGEPATISTGVGPWEQPLADFSIKANGGTAQVVPLASTWGVELVGTSVGDFEVPAAERELYVVVDSNSYEFTLKACYNPDPVPPFVPPPLAPQTSSAVVNIVLEISTRPPICFKHVGATLMPSEKFYYDYPVVVPPVIPPLFGAYSDLFPKLITELEKLGQYASASWNGDEITVTGLSRPSGPAAFNAEDVGRYLKIGSTRFEITKYVSATKVEVDRRGLTPSSGAGEIYGMDGPTIRTGNNGFWVGSSGPFYLKITVSPEFETNPVSVPHPTIPITTWVGLPMTILPATKRGIFNTGARTVANLISDLNDDADLQGRELKLHVRAQADLINSSKLALRARSKVEPYLEVMNVFSEINKTLKTLEIWEIPGYTVNPPIVRKESASKIVGFKPSQSDSRDILKPTELAELINAKVTGVTAEMVSTDISTVDGNTVAGQARVYSAAANFTTMGVQEWWQVEVIADTTSGKYYVDSVVNANTLALKTTKFSPKEIGQLRVFTETVKLTSTVTDSTSSIELVSPPSVLAFPATFVMGVLPAVKATDANGDPVDLEAAGVEAGDDIDVDGTPNTVAAVAGAGATLGTPIAPASGLPFSVTHSSRASYDLMVERISLLLNSRSYLDLHNFNVNLDALDAALSPVLAASEGLSTPRVKVRNMLRRLLTCMVETAKRSDEHGYSPTGDLHFDTTLAAYEVTPSEAVDNVLDALDEKHYDRATDLLLDGKFADFFEVSQETASYGGSVIDATKAVAKDLPELDSTMESISGIANSRTQVYEGSSTQDTPIEYPNAEVETTGR